ncbi:hypothetical protein P5G62_003680 [Neobacillus sp. 179-C4.2 HS]|uniref:Uncharacterized protein n=1 Tax=Neobacillus driksii TaxID=3035913 RepID=A0ABV4YN10_9BACI|nr:hypothetical protein [Neobacillus sp. 179.-C4.2 HS]MDP5193547.1 hypothetical protein [Neobacillus sp. 179.-C4.2 HS]
MRFIYKRPRMEDVSEELSIIMDLMVSKTFVMIDLFWLCLLFTLFLSPVLASVSIAVLFFSGSFALFSSIYFYLFYPYIKKN